MSAAGDAKLVIQLMHCGRVAHPVFTDGRRKVSASLEAVSTGLAAKPWCTGIHMTLADVAVGCALGYLEFRFPQIGWRVAHPNLSRLADKLNARNSFVDTAPPKA